MNEGYKELACAVISQAVDDFKNLSPTPNPKTRYQKDRNKEVIRLKKSAKKFLFNEGLTNYIKGFGLDLNAEYVRKSL